MLYDGSVIANTTSTIVVVLQYRLGAFGFLYTEGNVTGNFGIHDQRYGTPTLHVKGRRSSGRGVISRV